MTDTNDKYETSIDWLVRAFEEYHESRTEGASHEAAIEAVRAAGFRGPTWRAKTMRSKDRAEIRQEAGRRIADAYPDLIGERGFGRLGTAALGRILATLTEMQSVKFSVYDGALLYDDEVTDEHRR